MPLLFTPPLMPEEILKLDGLLLTHIDNDPLRERNLRGAERRLCGRIRAKICCRRKCGKARASGAWKGDWRAFYGRFCRERVLALLPGEKYALKKK